MASAMRGALRDRIAGAVLLDEDVYEDLKRDVGATGQAVLVVVLGALAAGIAALPAGPIAFAIGFVAALVGWTAYAYVAYWAATRWFGAEDKPATRGVLVRTLGFASAPRLLLVLGAIPLLGGLISLLVFVWILGTTVIAVRQGLDFDLMRAMGTALVSWLVLFGLSLLIAVIV